MIVASLSYDQMSKELREKSVGVLKQHPDFVKWQEAAPVGDPGFDLGRYLFMRASNWPDEIRRTGSIYDHPVWHYIDYPLVMPNFPMEPAPTGTEDVLFGLATSEKTLANASAQPVERAAALSWLIHLAGDIQQPLHCATLIGGVYVKPQGDRGGNTFFVNVAGNSINLHSLWDGLPGNVHDMRELTAQANALEKQFPRTALPELIQASTPLAWSLEGRLLAIDAVYLHGRLQGAHEPNLLPPPLPAGYITAAKALAERRLALGGYRLADELQLIAATAH